MSINTCVSERCNAFCPCLGVYIISSPYAYRPDT